MRMLSSAGPSRSGGLWSSKEPDLGPYAAWDSSGARPVKEHGTRAKSIEETQTVAFDSAAGLLAVVPPRALASVPSLGDMFLANTGRRFTETAPPRRAGQRYKHWMDRPLHRLTPNTTDPLQPTPPFLPPTDLSRQLSLRHSPRMDAAAHAKVKEQKVHFINYLAAVT